VTLLIAFSLAGAAVPEENYDFLSVTDGPCIPQQGVGLTPEQKAECARMTAPRHYRGTWSVGFEWSYFTPVGHRSCLNTKEQEPCIELSGNGLPALKRWGCAREFAVDFIGRRNVQPGSYPAYKIVVDRLISAKRMPDPPPDENCDPKRFPEPKAQQ